MRLANLILSIFIVLRRKFTENRCALEFARLALGQTNALFAKQSETPGLGQERTHSDTHDDQEKEWDRDTRINRLIDK